jgi:exoribonuclease R
MNIQAINSAIISGTWTNADLESMIDAVKFARSRLATTMKFQVRAGTKVRFTSSKRNQTFEGTVTKMAQKYATVATASGQWRVPANMLEIVA